MLQKVDEPVNNQALRPVHCGFGGPRETLNESHQNEQCTLEDGPFFCNFSRSCLIFLTTAVIPIDYRCDEGRFLEVATGLAIANNSLLSSSETEVNLGIIR